MASGRDVNEKCCAKVFEGWKSLARNLIFGGGGQIEERFLASLGMTAPKEEEKEEKKKRKRREKEEKKKKKRKEKKKRKIGIGGAVARSPLPQSR
jgi:hypothetical protein